MGGGGGPERARYARTPPAVVGSGAVGGLEVPAGCTHPALRRGFGWGGVVGWRRVGGVGGGGGAGLWYCAAPRRLWPRAGWVFCRVRGGGGCRGPDECIGLGGAVGWVGGWCRVGWVEVVSGTIRVPQVQYLNGRCHTAPRKQGLDLAATPKPRATCPARATRHRATGPRRTRASRLGLPFRCGFLSACGPIRPRAPFRSPPPVTSSSCPRALPSDRTRTRAPPPPIWVYSVPRYGGGGNLHGPTCIRPHLRELQASGQPPFAP